MRLIEFWLNHGGEFLSAILRHLALVAASTGVAVALGVPLGVVSYRNPRLGSPLIGVANRQAAIMIKAASELGFTPTSRAKVSIEANGRIEDPAEAFFG